MRADLCHLDCDYEEARRTSCKMLRTIGYFTVKHFSFTFFPYQEDVDYSQLFFVLLIANTAKHIGISMFCL